jgi:hypothetical protein
MPDSVPAAYLDHGVLDLMTKGDPHGVEALLQRAHLTPVFSDENLAEIRRSTGYELKFLDLLEQIGAKYLVPILDNRFRHTGTAEIRPVNPLTAYKAYVDNADSSPHFQFGPSGMLQKFYGSRQDQSFREIFSGGADELRQLLKKLEEQLIAVPGLDDATRASVAQAISTLPDAVEKQYSSLSAELDALPGTAVRLFEEATGLGPKVFKNVQPPEIVRKIWGHVETSPTLKGIQLDLETFFGIKPQPYEADADRERTTPEKVNAVYHQLNFLGYYRDSKMATPRRFVASFSDMTHAGLASFCHLLICRDEDLVKKTAAAYEYLGVGTTILHYESNK